MGSEIALSASLRQNLLSLQRTSSLLDDTTLRLNTGRRINSALDDPLNFFTSQSLANRATDLSRLLDGIGQSISAIEQANNGVTALDQLVVQAQSIVSQARDEISDGQVQAEIVGSRDISGEEDLTSINGANGITNNTIISFTLTDPNSGTPLFDGLDGGALTGGNTTIQAIGQIDFGGSGAGAGASDFASSTVSSDELITAINDINDQLRDAGLIGNDDVIEASLDENGQLSIRALNGGDLRINFISDATGGVTGATANNTSDNILVAQSLGLGNLANVLDDGTLSSAAGSAQFQDVVITALGQPSLLSNTLFAEETPGSGIARVAQASDSLESLFIRESLITGPGATSDRLFIGGGVAGASFDAGDSVVISVNGNNSASATIDLGGTPPPTIQDLVDRINNTGGLSDQIEASFNDQTGQIQIRAISPDVETIDIALTDEQTTGNFETQLGFGATQRLSASASAGTTDARVEERILLSRSASRLAELEQDFDSLRSQIDSLVSDSDFRGTNLLLGDVLLTVFNEDRTSFLETEGQVLNSSGLGLVAADFSRIDTIEDFETRTRDALQRVRGFGTTLANDLGVIEARENFTEVTITTLSTASDNLVLADPNEEAANLLALQTRSQLGLTSLSLASQGQQGILQLF